MSYRPIVPVHVRPVEHLHDHDLALYDAMPFVNVREEGDTAKTIAVIVTQGDIARAWMNSRPEERQLEIVQHASTGGSFFRRSVEARIRVWSR